MAVALPPRSSACPLARRGILAAGRFIAVGLLLARGGFAVGRDLYLDRLPVAMVARILDTLTRRFRDAVILPIAAGFLIAAAAWLAGPGPDTRAACAAGSAAAST